MRTSRPLRRSPRPLLLVPAPLAGLWCALSVFFLLIYFPKAPARGLVALEETPQQPGDACFNAPDLSPVFVCLTTGGRLSFAAADHRLQAAALRWAGRAHGMRLPAYQARSLLALPFLAVRLEQLPGALATPGRGQAAGHASSHATLTEQQLLDCVEAARKLSPGMTKLPIRICLLIDGHANAAAVMQLLGLFRQRQLYCLSLLTHCHS